MRTVPLEGTCPWKPSTKQKPEPKVELLYLTPRVPLVRIRMPEGWPFPWGLSGKGLAASPCPTIPARSRTAREAPASGIWQLLGVRLNIGPVAGLWGAGDRSRSWWPRGAEMRSWAEKRNPQERGSLPTRLVLALGPWRTAHSVLCFPKVKVLVAAEPGT